MEGPLVMNLYTHLFYNDLNNDGNSDKIYFGINDIGNVFCKVYDPVHRGQFNTTCNFNEEGVRPFFADIDKDNINEIIFTTKKDSAIVVLNIVNIETDVVEEFEICEVGRPGKRDYGAGVWNFIDLNNNGEKEIIIGVQAGFALQPRALYAFNPYSKEIKRTPILGSKLSSIQFEDIDRDGNIEIIAPSFTYQNFDSTQHFPFDDNWSRVFVFDHNLDFKFPPLKFFNVRSQARCNLVEFNNKSFLHVFVDTRGNKNLTNRQFLYGTEGEVLDTADFVSGNISTSREPRIFKKNGEVFVFDGEGNVLRMLPDLKWLNEIQLEQYSECNLTPLDVNGDGESEFVFSNISTGETTITDKNFKYPVQFSMAGEYNFWINPVLSQQEENKYLIRNNIGNYYLTYRINPIWSFRYVFFIGVLVCSYFLIWFLGKIQSYKIYEKQSLEREMQQLQYRVITSRFSPHYTFNVLTSFSNQIYNKENPELYDYFNKFIRQLRYLYDDKNAITRSLKEEIDFCRDYLDIQKMRFSKRFSYQLEIDESAPLNIKVPKMLLHTFVENAFKHGLRPYTDGGLIAIKVEHNANSNKILIRITDNGIGRQAARNYAKEHPEFSSGRGLEMLNQLVGMMNKKKKQKIEIETVDLIKNLQVGGTAVKILITLP